MKKALKKILALTLTACLSLTMLPGFSAAAAATLWKWKPVGSADFFASGACNTALAIDSSGTPYVAYSDYGNGYKATVKKYNNTNKTWEIVGNPGFSDDMACYTDIAIDNGGTCYVAYSDYGNGLKATVKKYNNTNKTWETVGNPSFSDDGALYNSLAFDKSGIPYVAYKDWGNGQKATVMKYNGSKWEAVGGAGFSADKAEYTSLAIDSSGTPYLAYEDICNSNKINVMKYNSNNDIWEAVGSAGFSAGSYISLAISNGAPYIAYSDSSNGDKATVMKYSADTGWVTVGSAGFSAGKASYISLAIDSNDTPYVAYGDADNGNKATVMKYNGNSWQTVDNAGVSAGGVIYNSLAIDSSGTPYVVYNDADDKVTVLKLTEVPACTVTYNAGAHGTISSASELVEQGSDPASIPTVTPSEGYIFKGWSSDNGVTLLTNAQLAAQTVNANITYTAYYIPPCTVTYNAGAHGTISSASELVEQGGNPASIPTVTSSEGYIFKGWSSDNGVTLLTNAQLAAKTITTDITYTVCYAPACTVTYNAGEHGSLSSTSELVEQGGSPAGVPAVTPGYGYYFMGWSSDGGEHFTTSDVLKTQHITDDITYTAYYGNITMTVKKWKAVGSIPYIHLGNITSLDIDKNGTPYVSYMERSPDINNMTIKNSTIKYDGEEWEMLGDFDGDVIYPSLAIDSSGTPYVVYEDNGNDYKATVKKYNNENRIWETVGNPDFSDGQAGNASLAFDSSGTPYVAYADYGNGGKTTVMKYNAASNVWKPVGNLSFLTERPDFTSFAIGSRDTLYVAYQDLFNDKKATVMKYNAASNEWRLVGRAGFSAGVVSYTSLTFDNSGTPYVAYSDDGNDGKATVMKYNSYYDIWENAGSVGLAAGRVFNTSLVNDSSGTPYLAYVDSDNNKATVMKYDRIHNVWITVFNEANQVNDTFAAIDKNGIPYVAYCNQSNITVMKPTDVPACKITYNPGLHGNIRGTGFELVEQDCTPDVPELLPNAGYYFMGWSNDGGKTLLSSDALQDQPINSDIAYTAYYKSIKVGNQTLNLAPDSGSSTTCFEVTTENITDNSELSVKWCNAKGDIIDGKSTGLSASTKAIVSGKSTITVTADITAANGTYYFKVYADKEFASNIAVLTVGSSFINPSNPKTDITFVGKPDPSTGTAIVGGLTKGDTDPSATRNISAQLGSATLTIPADAIYRMIPDGGSADFSARPINDEIITSQQMANLLRASGVTPVGGVATTFTINAPDGSKTKVDSLTNDQLNILINLMLRKNSNHVICNPYAKQDQHTIMTENLHVYYYNPDTGTLEDEKAVFDLDKGTAAFTTTHFGTFIIAIDKADEPAANIGVTYSAHVQKAGWQKDVSDGAIAGTTGKSLRLEGLKLSLTGNVPAGASITYQAHVQKLGWQKPVTNGTLAGTCGKSLRAEALKVTLNSLEGYQVKYRVYVQGKGWMAWQVSKNGTAIESAGVAGTTGQRLRIEAVQIMVQPI